MKKIILFIALALLVAQHSTAQFYSVNKFKYNPQTYVRDYTDAYDPTLCGAASFFVPGLGQVVAGETGRGIAFFGGTMGCAGLYFIGALNFMFHNMEDPYYYDNYSSSRSNNIGPTLMVIGALGMISVHIWSIVDAVKVAKVNNLYIRDLRKSRELGINDIRLSPYIDRLSINNTSTIPVGLKLSVSF